MTLLRRPFSNKKFKRTRRSQIYTDVIGYIVTTDHPRDVYLISKSKNRPKLISQGFAESISLVNKLSKKVGDIKM